MKRKLSKLLSGVMVAAMMLGGMQTDVFAARQNEDYSDFIRGADVSMLNEIEELGGRFYDNGTKKDALTILNSHGSNYVRLRLWVAYINEFSRICFFKDAISGADKRVNGTFGIASVPEQYGISRLLYFNL